MFSVISYFVIGPRTRRILGGPLILVALLKRELR